MAHEKELSEAINANKGWPNKMWSKKKLGNPMPPPHQAIRGYGWRSSKTGPCMTTRAITMMDRGYSWRYIWRCTDAWYDITPGTTWDQEFKEQICREIEDGQWAAAHCQAAGDGMEMNGSPFCVRHSAGLPRNYGDNSNHERQLYVEVTECFNELWE